MENITASRLSVEFTISSSKALPSKMWIAQDVKDQDYMAAYNEIFVCANALVATGQPQETTERTFTPAEWPICPKCGSDMFKNKAGTYWNCKKAVWDKTTNQNVGCKGYIKVGS